MIAMTHPAPRTSGSGTSHCDVCGRGLLPSAQDVVTQWTTSLAPLLQNLEQLLTAQAAAYWDPMAAFAPWLTAQPHTKPGKADHKHRHHERHEAHERHERHGGHDDRSCGSCDPCDPCATDGCGCRCCITDADLAVYTRLGEHRIVPIVVKNHWRRERDIRLSLQGWATSGGRRSPAVTSSLDATEFTLGPCSERQVVLSIDTGQVGGSRDAGAPTPVPAGTGTGPVGRAGKRELEISGGSAQKPGSTEGQGDTRDGKTEGNDVDQCTVLYADLTIEGCDTRPVRIALAILPRTCGAYELTCRSGCC